MSMKSSLHLFHVLRRLASRVLALGACAAALSSAQAGDLVPLRAAWDSQIELIPLAPPLVAVEGVGHGHSEHLGRMTAQSLGEIVNLETGDGLASYRFISASGHAVHVAFIFLALPLSPTQFAAGMLDQVVMNLAVNARDAMPGGGQLLIETSARELDEEFVRLRPDTQPGRYACLSVTDSGTGIPPQVLPHIFEPFFTTKESSKGTRLGLATVFGIVKQHQGCIEVASNPGRC